MSTVLAVPRVTPLPLLTGGGVAGARLSSSPLAGEALLGDQLVSHVAAQALHAGEGGAGTRR